MDTLKSYKQSVLGIYRRSFSRGVGSVIAVSGDYYPVPDLSGRRDMKALRSDWEAVGDYMWNALRHYGM